MKRIILETPLVSFRRPKNIKGELVRSRVPRSFAERMKRCGKSRCQISKFVKEWRSLHNNLGNRGFYVNYDLDCDSKGIVYLIKCKKCSKQYVGSTVTSFRMRFNNRKSSLMGVWEGLKGNTRRAFVMTI